MDLKKKVVVITGSSSGIGKETSLAFSEKGAYVVITYNKNKKGGEEVFNKCNKKTKCLLINLDNRNLNSIKDAIKKITKKFGKIDILINNSGVLYNKNFFKQSVEEIKEVIDVNLFGNILVTYFFCKNIKPKGIIINTVSRKGRQVRTGYITYCASKFGLRGFTKALALEVPKGIKVYAINPPSPTATRMTNFNGEDPKKVAKIMVKIAEGKIKKKNGEDIDV